MQIVDVNDLGVRSVILTLKRRDTPLTFVLFPMLHLGTPEFYAAVRARVEACDLAVVEGVGKSWQSSLLTLSYRLSRFNRRTGLIVQPLTARTLDVPVICPDLSSDEVKQGWRSLPWNQRAILCCLVPPLAVWMAVFGSRRVLARHAGRTDEPSDHDLELAASAPELEEFLVDNRDRRLLRALEEVHETRGTEPITVAVVYGAAHLPAVVYGLSKRYRYVARDGEYVTVFNL